MNYGLYTFIHDSWNNKKQNHFVSLVIFIKSKLHVTDTFDNFAIFSIDGLAII